MRTGAEQILKYIVDYYKKHTFYPGYEEIKEGIHVSKSTVYVYMQELEKEGVIVRKAKSSPMYRVINIEILVKGVKNG